MRSEVRERGGDMVTLREFLKLLDTMIPVTIYYYDEEIGTFSTGSVPEKWLDHKIDGIYIDAAHEEICIGVW